MTDAKLKELTLFCMKAYKLTLTELWFAYPHLVPV